MNISLVKKFSNLIKFFKRKSKKINLKESLSKIQIENLNNNDSNFFFVYKVHALLKNDLPSSDII